MQIRKYSHIWCSIAFILIIVVSLLFYNRTGTLENYENKPTTKKIAFCFLIIDKINHEELWHRFFEKADKNKYNIYIHYKENVPLKYLEEYKIQNCIETKWGDISLVKAQNIMLEEALKDQQNEHFIFLSNSCVPVKNFHYIYEFLNPDFSYFYITPNQLGVFPKCNKVLEKIEKQFIQKASQWSILNKKHAKFLTENTEYLPWFDYKEIVADEHCYITYLFHKNLKDEIILTHNDNMDATTFVNWNIFDWNDTHYKYKDMDKPNLKNYETISQEELKYIIDSKSLFARKFNPECDLSFLYLIF